MKEFSYSKDAAGIVTVTMDMEGPVNSMNAEFGPIYKQMVDRLEAAGIPVAFRSEAEYRRWLEQKLLWEAVADLLSTAETKGEGDDESESEVVPSKELRRAYLRSLREKAEVDRAGAPDALRSYLQKSHKP